MKIKSKYVAAIGYFLILAGFFALFYPLTKYLVDTEPPIIMLPATNSPSTPWAYPSTLSSIDFKGELYDRTTRPIWAKIMLEQSGTILLDWTEMFTGTMKPTEVELINPDFELGDLTGWNDVYANGVTTLRVHSGKYSAVSRGLSADQEHEIMVLYQEVDISIYAEHVDKGDCTVDAEGWVANRYDNNNWCKIQILFLNSASIEISSTDTGWLFSGKRWIFVKGEKISQPVPENTRFIRYCWWVKNDKGYDTEGFLDDVKLTLNIAEEGVKKVKEGDETYILFDYYYVYPIPKNLPIDKTITSKIMSVDEAGNIATVQWYFSLNGPEGTFYLNNQKIDRDVVIVTSTKELEFIFMPLLNQESVSNCRVNIVSIDGTDLHVVNMEGHDDGTFVGSYILPSNGTWNVNGSVSIDGIVYQKMAIILASDVVIVQMQPNTVITLILSLCALVLGIIIVVKGMAIQKEK